MASSLGVVGVLNSEYATKKAVEHIRNSLNFMMIPSVSVQEMFELEFLPEFALVSWCQVVLSGTLPNIATRVNTNMFFQPLRLE